MGCGPSASESQTSPASLSASGRCRLECTSNMLRFWGNRVGQAGKSALDSSNVMPLFDNERINDPVQVFM